MKKYFIIVILIITIGYFSNTPKKKIDRFILHKENNPIINVIEEQKPTPEPIVEQPKSHNSRMTSYWNEYYRRRYSDFQQYVGTKVFEECFGYSKLMER